MVYCCVIGCTSKSQGQNFRFFSIPAEIKNQCEKTRTLSQERRRLWLKRISRRDLHDENVDMRNTKVCDRHFISGEPAKLFDNLAPDWAPSIALGHDFHRKEAIALTVDRYLRGKQRERKRKEKKQALINEEDDVETLLIQTVEKETGLGTMTDIHGEDIEKIMEENIVLGNQVKELEKEVRELQNMLRDISIGVKEDVAKLNKETKDTRNDNIALRNEARLLKNKLQYIVISEETLANDNSKVLFYTGIPTFSLLKSIFSLVTKIMEFNLNSSLSPFQEFLVVMMRIRLNLIEQDLGYRFGVTQGTISRILAKWLPIMATRLKTFIVWPDRESLQTSMPKAFKDSFGNNVSVIIDCFEVFMKRPSSLSSRNATWSQYKHHNTVKFLIGVTPQGSVSFISKAWVGRVSDKELTESCGILNNLLKGDVVLADRGFNISDSVSFMCARLHIPAFTKGKRQLSYEDVETTRKIANVRIHVERVIGLVRNKYHILQGILPVETLIKRKEEAEAHIDYIVTICCALVNLCPSIVINTDETALINEPVNIGLINQI